MQKSELQVGRAIWARPTFDRRHWRQGTITYVHPLGRFLVVEFNLDRLMPCGELLRRRPREAYYPEQSGRWRRSRSS